jgi:hypothetical protein
LVAFNYYAAAKLKKEKKISLFPLTFASVLVGGLTITNIVKVYIPILFEKGLFKSFKTFFNAAIRVIISAAVFVLLFLYRLDWDYMRIFTKTGEQYEKFSKPKVTPLWDIQEKYIVSESFHGDIGYVSESLIDFMDGGNMRNAYDKIIKKSDKHKVGVVRQVKRLDEL